MMHIHKAAAMAAGHYRSYIDPALGIPYFYAFFPPEGAYGAHCEWDFGDATGRYVDALITCRKLLGDAPYPEEGVLKDALARMFGADGLSYRPELPPIGDGTANSFDQRSALIGLLSWYQDGRDPKVGRMIDALIEGISRIGIWWDDYFYIPYVGYRKGDAPSPHAFTRADGAVDPCHYGGGVLILPLMQYHLLTGDEPALRMAQALTRFILEHAQVFAPDGSFWVDGLSDCDGHFHSRMGSVCGAMYCALETGNRAWLDRCLGIYRFAKAQGTGYGLFPEGLGARPVAGAPEEYPPVARHSEICGTTDMLHIALLLSSRGVADGWDDAERFCNQLFASQLTDIDWVPPSSGEPGDPVHTFTDVAERYKGAFTGRTQPNDLLNEGRYDTMGCCAAAGGRALGLLRAHGAARRGDSLIVRLWLGMEDDMLCCAVDEDGSLRVTPRQAGRALVRWPDWLKNARLTVCGREAAFGCVRLDGATYIDIGEVGAGETAHVMPVGPVDVLREELFCGETLRILWRGNRVRHVSPEGIRPIYTQTGIANRQGGGQSH